MNGDLYGSIRAWTPDDRTPLALKNARTEVIAYGAPVLPAVRNVFLSYFRNILVIGLPGCAVYAAGRLPKLMADIKIMTQDLAQMGDGEL